MFWTDANVNPKRNHQWKVTFGDANLGNLSFTAKKCTKPALEQSDVTHKYLNYEFYYPGTVQRQPITVTVVNIAGGSDVENPKADADSAFAIASLINRSGYVIPKTANDSVTMSKSKAIRAFKNFTIYQITSEGNILEEWKLRNAWLQNISFSELEYGNAELSEIIFTIRYDFAQLKINGQTVEM